MTRNAPWFLCLVLLMPLDANAEEDGGDSCCQAVARGLPIAGLALAVGAAGDKPLHVLADDDATLEFDLAVCREHLLNALLKAGQLRAKDCGDSYGLFGADVPAARADCAAVAAPAETRPPGTLDGWRTTVVFTEAHGERLALVSGPDGGSFLLGPGMALDNGASVEGIGAGAVLVLRGGIDALDTSRPPLRTSALGEPPTPSCVVVDEVAPATAAPVEVDAASEAEAQGAVLEGGVDPADDGIADDDDSADGDAADAAPTEKVYECEGYTPDFIQRPLPVEVCDAPEHAGKQVTAIVEFGIDGWPRRVVSLDYEAEDVAALLGVAIRDWRVIPLEIEGVPARVRVTVPFDLTIPCR